MPDTRPLLLLRVMAELGAGRIREGWIPSERDYYADGETCGKNITINPAAEVVDNLLHHLLARLYPQWSERYIKNRVSYLMKRMTDEEVRLLYAEYQQRAKKGKYRRVEE